MSVVIPVTEIHQLYIRVRGMPQKQRLALLHEYLEHPDALEATFSSSVAEYAESYGNALEGFHPARKPSPRCATSEITRGVDVQRLMAEHGSVRPLAVRGAPKECALRFVDFEVPPLRTTGGARFADGRRSRGFVADILGVRGGGVPVVCEVKAVTSKSYDADAALALVQGLASVAALTPSTQRERLQRHYPGAGFAPDGPVALYVLAVKPKVQPPASLQPLIDDAARALARLVCERGNLPQVADLRYIATTWDGKSLRLEDTARA